MNKSAAGRPIIYTGTQKSIQAAVRLAGDCPSVEFLNERSDADKRKLAALFQRMGDHGRIDNRQKFKHLERAIFEFKSHQIRILCFQTGQIWVLTHGLIKKKDKLSDQEIDRAEKIMNEDFERVAALSGS